MPSKYNSKSTKNLKIDLKAVDSTLGSQSTLCSKPSSLVSGALSNWNVDSPVNRLY